MKRREFLKYAGTTSAALSLSPLIAACGSGPSTSGSGGSGNVTIQWWHIATNDPQKSAWQTLANQYMKAHPNVNIKITLIDNASYKPKLATTMQSGSPPDLFHSWGGGVLFKYAHAGLVKDLTSDLQGDWGDSITKAALDVYGDNGKYYGVPWDMGAVGFWYNKALFAKAGITQTPTTWTDFLQLIQKLKSAGITPIALGEGEKWPGHFYWAYLAVRLGGKDAFVKAYNRTGSFASQPFIDAGKYLQQLVALKPFQTGSLGATYNDEQSQMGNGKAAMELQGQWAPSNDQNSATDKKGPELGFFPFPMVEGGAGNPTDVFGGGGGYAIGKNAPPQTVDFLKFLTSAQSAEYLVKQKTGYLTPTKAAAGAITDPFQQEIVQLVAKAPYFQLYYDQYLPQEVGSTAVLNATQGLFANTMTPQAAAQLVESAAARAMA
ncbi:MAG TPA: extracellular solute-binding protein [Ktedonobacteraceae bacterium]|nr:extracellular solute-binding protein [Ktedonobacteraceae bacterium]